MPAKSAAQQKAAGAALSAKRGETPKSELQGPSAQMADSMSESQLGELASTKRKGKWSGSCATRNSMTSAPAPTRFAASSSAAG